MILLQGAMGAGLVLMEILKGLLILSVIVIVVIYFLLKVKEPKVNSNESDKNSGEK